MLCCWVHPEQGQLLHHCWSVGHGHGLQQLLPLLTHPLPLCRAQVLALLRPTQRAHQGVCAGALTGRAHKPGPQAGGQHHTCLRLERDRKQEQVNSAVSRSMHGLA